jgi:hypothetical protein
MVARNQLLEAPPYPVEQALTRLGHKIGTGPRAIRDAEKGKASTGIGVYVALLWVYDLLSPFKEVANPALDEHGLTLAAAKENTRARKGAGLDNDF